MGNAVTTLVDSLWEKDEVVSILREYYESVLGKLQRYDLDHYTDYVEFLKLYLDNNCSVQKIAAESFVHRNTINYRIGKIKKITGYNLRSIQCQSKLFLAYQIRDMLDKTVS